MSLFQRKLNDLKTIKLSVKSLNGQNGHLIGKMISLFQRMEKTICFSNFYQEYLQKNTMGVFQYWNAESIQIDVLESETCTDWPELYIYMKPFLTFYVIDMNNMVQDELIKARKRSTDEKLIRFLIFNCNPELLQNMDNESLFIIIPELNDEKLMIYLEDQLQMFVCQVIEYFAYEILRLKSDQSLLVLFNMREEKISEQSKLKRRRQGRQYKIMGDMALMVQANQDALEYYRQALEILNKVGDNLWAAITYQSMAALRQNQDEIEEHFREALILFKKTKFVNLEIECFFKLMKLKCDWGDKLGLDKTVDIFTKTFDPESPVEKCKFYCFVSELYGKLKMVRKEAYHLKLASNQIYSINRQLSLELMEKAAKLYQMNSLFEGNSNLFWDSMQRTLAQEIRQFFVESKHYTQIQILQFFKEDYSNQKLLGYFEELKEDSKGLQLHQGNLPLIPKILNLRILNHDYLVKEEHSQQIEDEIFIVNPWAHKEKKVQLFPKDLEIHFELEVENIYQFALQIELIQLQFDGCECVIYPKTVNILGGKQYISLCLIPKNEGQLRIFGIKIQYMNYYYIHKIEEQIIQIIESLPDVDAVIYRDHCLINDIDAVYFDPSEIFTYQIIVQNKGDRIIDHCSFELCIEAEDPPIYETKQDIITFNLDAYSKTTLLLSESNGIIIPQIPHSMKSCKKISLSFFFYYQKSHYQREIKLNRQIQIRPKCTINQCLFITKYQSQDQIEIYDLQDTCYLSLQIQKFQFLLELELKSQILLDGSFKTILNEDIHTYSKVLKLCKLPKSKLDDPDLYIHWRNPLNGTTGKLKPLESLTKQDMFKHFCNDLIEIQCKEEKPQLSYKLTIHQQLSNSEEVFVNISLTNEIFNCSKSVVSSVKNQTAVISQGFINYKLKLNRNEPTIKYATLSIICNGPMPDLKFVILDKQNNRQFIKRTSVN